MADFLTVLVPFLFILAIVYGALDVAGVFRNRRVNALIALVFAFFTLTYSPAIDFINQIMPWAIIFFVAFFFLGFIIKIAKKGVEKDYMLLIIIVGLLLLFLATQGTAFLGNLPGFADQQNTIIILAGIVLIAAILLAAYKTSKT